MSDRIRSRLIGLVVALPFALLAALVAAVVFDASVAGIDWPAEWARALDVGPLGPPAALIGVSAASALLAPRLAEPWADRLGIIIRWILLSHGLAALVGIGLAAVAGSTDPSVLPTVLLKVLGTLVGASWLYAISGALWVAIAGKLIRRDAPATADESAASAAGLRGLIRGHVKDDATLLGSQQSTSRRWRD
jgi:hypothetical protein